MQRYWRTHFIQYFSMGPNEMLFSHSRDWLVGTILDEPAIFRNFYRKIFQDNHRIFLQIRIENMLVHHPASRNFVIRLHFRVLGIMSNENFPKIFRKFDPNPSVTTLPELGYSYSGCASKSCIYNVQLSKPSDSSNSRFSFLNWVPLVILTYIESPV